jgi:SAM-dependent methyltransferase
LIAQSVKRFATRVRRRTNKIIAGDPATTFPLRPALAFPPGYDEAALYAFVSSVRVADAPEADMLNYCRSDFRRFVYTWSLAANAQGRALELGANPYFTTMLLREFARLDLTLANYFTEGLPSHGEQNVFFRNRKTTEPSSVVLPFDHFNIENDRFPYDDGTFSVVLFCEIVEHLLMDPLRVLREIRRVLRSDGELILTTPNVSRLENVSKMIAGANIYDPYSGFGPYGRHNREYNKHELHHLLTYAGFTPEVMFSADVHDNNAYAYAAPDKLADLVGFRKDDLGQYLFVRARSTPTEYTRKPDFLYRSYPPDELERWP